MFRLLVLLTFRASTPCAHQVMTILNQDLPEIRGLTSDEKSIMYAFLDKGERIKVKRVPALVKLGYTGRLTFLRLERFQHAKDGSNCISLEEFQEFSSVLLIRLSRKSDYTTWVEKRFPSVFHSAFYQRLSSFVKSNKFENTVEVILVLNALIAAGQDYPILAGRDVTMDPHYQEAYINTVWEAAETVFTILYVVEAMLKIMVNGWKAYSESPRNTFDFAITIMAVLASAYVYCK